MCPREHRKVDPQQRAVGGPISRKATVGVIASFAGSRFGSFSTPQEIHARTVAHRDEFPRVRSRGQEFPARPRDQDQFQEALCQARFRPSPLLSRRSPVPRPFPQGRRDPLPFPQDRRDLLRPRPRRRNLRSRPRSNPENPGGPESFGTPVTLLSPLRSISPRPEPEFPDRAFTVVSIRRMAA